MEMAVIEKFWKFVVKGEKSQDCWIWSGRINRKGTPIFTIGGRGSQKEYSANRISFEINRGQLIPGLPVLNICKQQLCVNPNHLVHGDVARFWSKVCKLKDEHGGCWVWTGNQDKDTYGKFTYYNEDGKQITIRAHVYSWQLHYGKPKSNIAQVCHKCDHPYCVNPYHLFLGTHQDNVDDKLQKGRQPIGEACGSSKLTEGQVKQIRELRNSGMSIVQLSKKFGMGTSAISSLLQRKSWKHVL